MVVAASAPAPDGMEAEAQASASLACHLASLARSHQDSPRPHLAIPQLRQALPALVLLRLPQATWRRLPLRTTRRRRRGTALLHRRRTHPRLLPGTRRRRHSTRRRRLTTVPPHRRLWAEQHHQLTARRRHSTALHRRNTVRRARSTKQAATVARPPHRPRPSTVRPRRDTRLLARPGPSLRPRRAIARRLRARHTRQRKSPPVIVVDIL